MTLSERFAMYQRKAAEAEIRKPRKSPEIHRYSKYSILGLRGFSLTDLLTDWGCCSLRRIDVSPSAFKRHTHLFDDMEEAGYKVTSPFEISHVCNKETETFQSSSIQPCAFLLKDAYF